MSGASTGDKITYSENGEEMDAVVVKAYDTPGQEVDLLVPTTGRRVNSVAHGTGENQWSS